MNSGCIKENLKAEAEKLGFSFYGFTAPEPPKDFVHYQNWLDKNYYGEMGYLARIDAVQKRANPKLLFPGTNTIMVLGTSIRQVDQQSDLSVASFAHYYDYHDQIKTRCRQLIETVSAGFAEKPDYRVFVDSSPVLERSLAVQAGLGWIGKSSMFIHPLYGSFNLLAEIFLPWNLPDDLPYAKDGCGSCTRCVDACPMGCIDPVSRTIYANQCISYLTIEHKGDLSERDARKCGEKVFGCDICAAVCPWNARRNLADTYLEPFEFAVDLSTDLDLSETEFRMKYKNTPILRSKLSNWKRNISNALGNKENRSL